MSAITPPDSAQIDTINDIIINTITSTARLFSMEQSVTLKTGASLTVRDKSWYDKECREANKLQKRAAYRRWTRTKDHDLRKYVSLSLGRKYVVPPFA